MWSLYQPAVHTFHLLKLCNYKVYPIVGGVTCSKSVFFITVALRRSKILSFICYFLNVGSQFYVSKMEAVLTLRFRRETGAQVFAIDSSKLPSKLQYSKVNVKLALCTLWRVRIVAYMLYVATKSGSDISFTTRQLYPRRSPRYPHSSNFMQPGFSLPYSQELALCSYPEPDQSSS
jgi:hypothetical protein